MEIFVSIVNNTSENYICHVFDLFGYGRREVDGSPFALSPNQPGGPFLVNAGENGDGTIEYNCEGGPSETNIPVRDGSIEGFR